jgi:glycosyltransferase involved in cell wall biosynthesis
MPEIRMLMVVYGFPPRGGGGVQRNVKFLKYLSRLGVKTSVLTVRESDFYVYDTTLLDEIKDTTSIYRADSLDPASISSKVKRLVRSVKRRKAGGSADGSGSGVKEEAWYIDIYRRLRDIIMLPDAYGGWIPFACRLGKKIIAAERPNVLFGSFPGPSNAFVTYKLAKEHDIPYVLDFRDGWTDDPYVHYPTSFHRRYHASNERKIVLGAKKVIVNTETLKERFQDRYPSMKGKIETMTNGFDPEDLENLSPVPKESGKVRIVYSGAVFVDRRESFVAFLQAVGMLKDETRRGIEIIFVGQKHDWAQHLIEQRGLQRVIRFTGYLSHKSALNHLASADVAMLFLAKGDRVAIPGKLYEYLGLGLPVIAAVEEDGACSRLLKSINHDQGVCDPATPSRIGEKLALAAEKKLPRLPEDRASAFSRKAHAERLKDILETIVK